MITEDFFIFLLFQIILLSINLIGYSKIPYLGFIGIIGTLILAYPTAMAFSDYPEMTIILILVNIMIPILGINKARTGR
jgi:hypothetical protein